MQRVSLALLVLLAWLAAGPVYGGTCSNPAGNEADDFYNKDYHTFQFCNGTYWVAFGGQMWQGSKPSGTGYFVMSKSTWNGNLGDLAGTDAKCLTELTTNTGWRGYSTASSNGQLVSGKVHAFLCRDGFCNSLTPLATYFFANAGDSSAGGASFTVDVNGDGPNDAANWSAANYFNGTYAYWTNFSAQSNSLWSDTASQTYPWDASIFPVATATKLPVTEILALRPLTAGLMALTPALIC